MDKKFLNQCAVLQYVKGIQMSPGYTVIENRRTDLTINLNQYSCSCHENAAVSDLF